jgi:plasmid stabilization system protein ParE
VARTVRWAENAIQDLEEAASFIARDSVHYAAILVLEARDAARSLAHFASRGRVVPELAESEVRELFIHDYRLIYEVQTTTVFVLAFIHGARDLRRALKK